MIGTTAVRETCANARRVYLDDIEQVARRVAGRAELKL